MRLVCPLMIFRLCISHYTIIFKRKQLLDLIKQAFKMVGTLYLACNDRSTDHRGYNLWSCQNVCDALSYFSDNIYIKFDNKLYIQIICIQKGTNCAPLVADMFILLQKIFHDFSF